MVAQCPLMLRPALPPQQVTVVAIFSRLYLLGENTYRTSTGSIRFGWLGPAFRAIVEALLVFPFLSMLHVPLGLPTRSNFPPQPLIASLPVSSLLMLLLLLRLQS